MSKERIAELLQQLQNELADAGDVNEDLRERLHRAAQEVQTTLEQTTPPPVTPEDDGLIGQLREAADQFEESHPTLTHTVGRIADALAQLGI